MRIHIAPDGEIQADGQNIGRAWLSHNGSEARWTAMVGQPRRWGYDRDRRTAVRKAVAELAAFWRQPFGAVTA
jgi:hypothetical protein